ncbi:serine hydrolase [Deinococcus peraridilitoris]|uniref:Beta-lactamase class A n=1 Tax=Deinococcus peraridilitoris (strain DSM 19664 / LMG 22246 / CIP 109416 / KR-200) TaxID=937777 RepID=K9ZXE4_DEIPD|nr:serine hydrolase [Deinococcus peraridilitoris]AFZ66328.1 beta-lactamase class A [Deinococcus peraridilitoris DSM 19664]
MAGHARPHQHPDLQFLLASHPGTVSVRVLSLQGEVLFDHQSERPFPSASLIKVPLLVRALWHVQQGQARLEERLTLRAYERVPGSGVLSQLDAGLALTLRDVLTLMTVVSDNTATNLVIDRFGLHDVNVFLREAGMNNSELIGQLQLPPGRQNERQRAGERNRTSAHDISRLLLRLVRGELLSPALTDLALDILSRQQVRDIIARHVPRGADGELLYRVASKGGELSGVRHDAGIVWTPRPLILALLSEGGSDLREHPDNREVALLARLAGHLIAVLGDIPPEPAGLE